ncbi:hypothetical protein PRIPAC_96388 [Pristionchus pacificus]|uniref:Uncharacterized protein n=1 Tax=Pristionchus pacificus TaxID=54126 RepID=A0A2A6B2K4_PRIPA|nr:hypothetical protein PRIPAC_96388 [Pristionchus pacificus]|eukprot:PDM60099.1 hypothetical protein PRIPAC_49385 [Pristionchus pacificus]
MSDGVEDADFTVRRLLELKKVGPTVKEWTLECFRVCGINDCKGARWIRCRRFVEREIAKAETKLRNIRRRPSQTDELYYLNSYCGLAAHLGISLSLTPLPPPFLITLLIPAHSVSIPSKSTVSCETCQIKSRKIKNISRRLKRAQTNLRSHKLCLISQSKSANRLARSNKRLSKENHRLRDRVARLSERYTVVERNFRFLENANEVAQENLAEAHSGIVNLSDDRGVFSPDTVRTVMELSDYGVADERVGGVIESVCRLVGVQIDKVPSPSTVRNISLSSLTVAKMHVSERLGDAIDAGEYICLLSDETNKKGNKYQLFGAGLAKGDGGQDVMVFGLTQVADKTAKTAFDVLRERLDSLGGLGRGSEIDQFTDRFLAATTCTMSDRASTQLKFNAMIADYRASVLPKITAGWDKMTSEEQERTLEFHEFYCQLHTIANLTNVVLEILAEHERIVTGKEVPDLSPTVFAVVKEVARLFGDRSAGMHGCALEFKAWSKQNLSDCSFPSFLGHRFNVVFLLAARIFSQKQKLVQIIDECGGSKVELVKLAELLRLPLISEHLQILGMIDQLVTGPLWRVAENLKHVLETRSHASLLLSWVGHCKGDPISFFSRVSPVPSLQTIAAGTEEMLGKLLSVATSESSLEATVLLMEAMERYFKCLFVDFIDGGKYSGEVSEDTVERTQCALGHNRHIESAFGFVDRLHTHSPNMIVPRRLAKLMISKNHTTR